MSGTELFLLTDKFYNEFISDESVIGIESLLRRNGIGSKRRIKIRRAMYDKYGEEKLKKIYRDRLSKFSHKKRLPESYKHSEETKLKIRKSNRMSWSLSPDRRELSRKNMVEFCAPNSQSEEAKQKRVESRKWYRHSKETIARIKKSNSGRKLTEEHKAKLRKTRVRRGVPHSEETKKRLSEITKSQWKSGIHKPKFKSKGQLEVIEILREFGYVVEDEYIVNGRPFDVFIIDKNLLIEFNGTFWHRDPRVEKYKLDPLSESIWLRDKEKIDTAKEMGYDTRVIWQKDWESCQDKRKYLQQIL